MTSSSSPLRGALRVLSATAIVAAAGFAAAPAYAADASVKTAAFKVSADATSEPRNRRSSKSRNRNTRSDARTSRNDRNRSNERTRSQNSQNRNVRRNEIRKDNRQIRRQETRQDNRNLRRVVNRSLNSYYAPRHSYARNSNPWSRHTGRNKFRSNYRSGLGISFSFGSPGYSRYRWAPSRHSFYRASYGSHSYYTRNTTCRQVLLDSQWNGRIRTVEVTECSNPWDGTYIVQGSERFVGQHYY